MASDGAELAAAYQAETVPLAERLHRSLRSSAGETVVGGMRARHLPAGPGAFIAEALNWPDCPYSPQVILVTQPSSYEAPEQAAFSLTKTWMQGILQGAKGSQRAALEPHGPCWGQVGLGHWSPCGAGEEAFCLNPQGSCYG